MKATIDIPDDVYRRVKAKSALEGRAVREVAVELFRGYLDEAEGHSPPSRQPEGVADQPLPSWFGVLRHVARRAPDHDLRTIRQGIARGAAREEHR